MSPDLSRSDTRRRQQNPTALYPHHRHGIVRHQVEEGTFAHKLRAAEPWLNPSNNAFSKVFPEFIA